MYDVGGTLFMLNQALLQMLNVLGIWLKRLLPIACMAAQHRLRPYPVSQQGRHVSDRQGQGWFEAEQGRASQG